MAMIPPPPAAKPPFLQGLSTFLYRYPILFLLLLLLPPLLWLGVVYLGSLVELLVNSFYSLDDFTGMVVRRFTLSTYAQLFTPANLDIFRRTAGMAAAVTVADAVLAFPLAYYIARYASGRLKPALYLAVILPLWSSYLVRVYAWKLILAKEGIISWLFQAVGLQGVLDGVLAIPGLGGSSLSAGWKKRLTVGVFECARTSVRIVGRVSTRHVGLIPFLDRNNVNFPINRSP